MDEGDTRQGDQTGDEHINPLGNSIGRYACVLDLQDPMKLLQFAVLGTRVELSQLITGGTFNHEKYLHINSLRENDSGA